MAPHLEHVRLIIAGTVIFFGVVVAGYILVKRKSRRKDSDKDNEEESDLYDEDAKLEPLSSETTIRTSSTTSNHLEQSSKARTENLKENLKLLAEEVIQPARSDGVSAITSKFEKNESINNSSISRVLEKTPEKEAMVSKTNASQMMQSLPEQEIKADEVGLKFRINVRASSKSPGRDTVTATSSAEGESKYVESSKVKIVAEKNNSDLNVSSSVQGSPVNLRNVEEENNTSSSKSLTSRALEEFYRKRKEAAKALASGSSPIKTSLAEDVEIPERSVKVTEDLVSWECIESETNSEKVELSADDELSKPLEVKSSNDSKYSSQLSSENTLTEQRYSTRDKNSPEKQNIPTGVNTQSPSSNVSDPMVSPAKSPSSGSDCLLAIQAVQRNPQHVTGRNADVLMSQLETTDNGLLLTLLDLVSKSSAFTYNQNLFRQHGCIGKLTKVLKYHSMAFVKLGFKSSQSVLAAAANAINNLSLNEENHKQFKDCIPSLVDLSITDKLDDATQVACMQALTNLSVLPTHHGQYTRLIQKLYSLVDQENNSIKLQSLKILVNLSTNPEMVPHLLAAKAPSSLLMLLDQNGDEALILRWTTLLANILHTVKDKNITTASLPTDEKAPSPETMYIALFGMDKIGPLKTKVFLLSKHKNEDIRHHATRMYSAMK